MIIANNALMALIFCYSGFKEVRRTGQEEEEVRGAEMRRNEAGK